MATMHTPPIDLYGEDEVEEQDPVRDDREIGFGLQAFPDGNGDRDDADVERGEQKLAAVLGW
jgi:hypothetical protein